MKICFIHYGIGWADGVNVVINNLASEMKKQRPDMSLCFLAGDIAKKNIKGKYILLKELKPDNNIDLTKKEYQAQAEKLAKKIGQLLQNMDVVIIENPLMGDYHLRAMLSYFYYVKKYKSNKTKVYFHIHDLFIDNPNYLKNFYNLFSDQDRKEIFIDKNIAGFFIINQVLKNSLINLGISKSKIQYLPNGINAQLFNQDLSQKDKELIRKSLGIRKDSKLIIYPVRVIPRKNIEEAILLISLIKELTNDDYTLVIPGKIDLNDKLSQEYYQQLQALSAMVDYPVLLTNKPFPLKRRYEDKKIKKYSIADLYKVSDFVIISSVLEGFGLPYLEAWLAKKMIIGRRHDKVISDFEQSNLNFSWLYHNLTGLNASDYDQRIEQIKKILINSELKTNFLKNNRKIIEAQIKALNNKTVINYNYKLVKKIYSINKITTKLLNKVNKGVLCRHHL